MTTITLKRARTPHYDDPTEVGRRIHEAREQAGLSQRELAFPGCTAAYISRIEHGERIPSLQVIRQIAARTGVTEDEIAYGRDPLTAEVAAALADIRSAVTSEEQAKAYRWLKTAAGRAIPIAESGALQ